MMSSEKEKTCVNRKHYSVALQASISKNKKTFNKQWNCMIFANLGCSFMVGVCFFFIYYLSLTHLTYQSLHSTLFPIYCKTQAGHFLFFSHLDFPLTVYLPYVVHLQYVVHASLFLAPTAHTSTSTSPPPSPTFMSSVIIYPPILIVSCCQTVSSAYASISCSCPDTCLTL